MSDQVICYGGLVGPGAMSPGGPFFPVFIKPDILYRNIICLHMMCKKIVNTRLYVFVFEI